MTTLKEESVTLEQPEDKIELVQESTKEDDSNQTLPVDNEQEPEPEVKEIDPDPSPTAPAPAVNEKDIPSFREWTQKTLEEEQKKREEEKRKKEDEKKKLENGKGKKEFNKNGAGNVQFFVNLIFILYARWRFKIVCLQTKLASLANRKEMYTPPSGHLLHN